MSNKLEIDCLSESVEWIKAIKLVMSHLVTLELTLNH